MLLALSLIFSYKFLPMQCYGNVVYANIVCLCVCLSVCVSVTHQYCFPDRIQRAVKWLCVCVRITQTMPHDSPGL